MRKTGSPCLEFVNQHREIRSLLVWKNHCICRENRQLRGRNCFTAETKEWRRTKKEFMRTDAYPCYPNEWGVHPVVACHFPQGCGGFFPRSWSCQVLCLLERPLPRQRIPNSVGDVRRAEQWRGERGVRCAKAAQIPAR